MRLDFRTVGSLRDGWHVFLDGTLLTHVLAVDDVAGWVIVADTSPLQQAVFRARRVDRLAVPSWSDVWLKVWGAIVIEQDEPESEVIRTASWAENPTSHSWHWPLRRP